MKISKTRENMILLPHSGLFLMRVIHSLKFVLKLAPKKLFFNPLSANSTKWSNTLKQFVGF